MFKRFLSLILALVIASSLLGGTGTVRAASVSAEEMEALIEKQIRAFGDSIDKSNADDNAATALAKHGMRGGGKKLSVGKSHALTATLFNSELLQIALTKYCTAAIKSMSILDLASMPYICGNCSWYGEEGSFYNCANYDGKGWEVENKDFTLTPYITHTEKRNAYDSSLDWMAANTQVFLNIKRAKITATEVTYTVSCTVKDRFDFSTSNSSGFKGLISGIGAVLFKEFDWEASASFNLAVPYTCTHSSGMYQWTYDSDAHHMTSNSTDGYTKNETSCYSVGSTSYYYELDETVRLYHDEPWILEYDIQNPSNFVLTSFNNVSASTSTSMPCLRHWRQDFLFVWNEEHLQRQGESQRVRNYYGTALKSLFSYNNNESYTFRLENEVKSGGNMIYLTVSKTATGEILLEKIPMDDYYRHETWVGETIYKSDSNNWANGKDLFINYIGNVSYPFSADYFELRIWENGKDCESESYCKTKVTKPTCTAQGYTTYTCSCCGYSYKADKVKATGHSFGEWTTVTDPTCTEVGSESRKCKTCGESENREIAATGHSHEAAITAPTCTAPGFTTYTCACGDSYVGDETAATGHSFENRICIACGEREYILGDVNLDGKVDVDDVLALLWHVLFPEEYPIEVPADFDGNGTTDVDDVLALLWHVLFPEEYPLD